MIVMLDKQATEVDIEKAREEYGDYIKITIDIGKNRVGIGGEYHFDVEQVLLSEGSKQKDIWGGGLNLVTKDIRTNAMVNIRAESNPSPDILNEEIRLKFIEITKHWLHEYTKK